MLKEERILFLNSIKIGQELQDYCDISDYRFSEEKLKIEVFKTKEACGAAAAGLATLFLARESLM